MTGGRTDEQRRSALPQRNRVDRDPSVWLGPPPDTDTRVRLDGKHFQLHGRRFPVRGVTYGTFPPRSDGALFPEHNEMKQDFVAMSEAGFSVVRTYTRPPDDLLDLAADWGLHVLAGIEYGDWRDLFGTSRRGVRRVARDARWVVRAEARRLRDCDQVLGLVIGNEVPADVVRWYGADRVAKVLGEMVEIVREEDAERLVSYANYPTAEWLPLDDVDFLLFNVFLERHADLRRYLTRLHHLAGDRPVVLGEIGMNAGGGPEGERRQAEALEWQLECALERGLAGACIFSWTDEWWVDGDVEGWAFGLTRRDRSARPALDVACRWNERTVADLKDDWPSVSVVVCAHNASSTLEECLSHTCALDYPDLEILVVDDGSQDETGQIARSHPRVRLIQIPHSGLSVARNEGFRHATGEIVAYLDADAYPLPEWPYYLVLAFDEPSVAGVGGPNVPPPNGPLGAQLVAHAPGGPVHVLLSDDRAEHVPGCNMAFYRYALHEVGGFDPVYGAAGDDVDLCWKILDRGWDIAFHPAALVWHHRRPGLRPYLRQQRGYGRAEALVEARHPDRFTPVGTARWRGRIYDSLVPAFGRQRVYRGVYGSAAYQSVYRGGGHTIDIAHQIGVLVSVAAVATAPLAVLDLALGIPAITGLLFLLALGMLDIVRTHPPRRWGRSRMSFRLGVTLMHLLQPLMRSWGRIGHTPAARRDLRAPVPLAGPATRPEARVLLLPADRPRMEIAQAIVDNLRGSGLRVFPSTGWEDYDARFMGSLLLSGEIITSAHPRGCVQIRVRRRGRTWPLLLVGVTAATGWIFVPLLGALATLLGIVEAGRGVWRTGPAVRRIVARAASRSDA